MECCLNWDGWNFVGDGRCVGLGPHPRIKAGAGSSPLAPNGKRGRSFAVVGVGDDPAGVVV